MRRVLALAVWLLAASLAYSEQPELAETKSGPFGHAAPTSQLWLVNSRHMPACDQAENSHRLTYMKYAPDGTWRDADRSEFEMGELRHAPIVVLASGAPASFEQVIEISTSAFWEVASWLPADRPVRFVVWSWPSDRGRGRPLPVYRDLAVRAESQAYYLASFVDGLDRGVAVTLVGYSFGARITSAALQLLAGGEVPYNPPLARRLNQGQRISAIQVAAAMDCDWLLPGSRYGEAVTQVEQMVITVNACDPALKRYPKLYGILRHYPSAMGLVGMCDCNEFGTHHDRLEQLDLTSVGKTHDALRHLASPLLQERFLSIMLAPERLGR